MDDKDDRTSPMGPLKRDLGQSHPQQQLEDPSETTPVVDNDHLETQQLIHIKKQKTHQYNDVESKVLVGLDDKLLSNWKELLTPLEEDEWKTFESDVKAAYPQCYPQPPTERLLTLEQYDKLVEHEKQFDSPLTEDQLDQFLQQFETAEAPIDNPPKPVEFKTLINILFTSLKIPDLVVASKISQPQLFPVRNRLLTLVEWFMDDGKYLDDLVPEDKPIFSTRVDFKTLTLIVINEWVQAGIWDLESILSFHRPLYPQLLKTLSAGYHGCVMGILSKLFTNLRTFDNTLDYNSGTPPSPNNYLKLNTKMDDNFNTIELFTQKFTWLGNWSLLREDDAIAFVQNVVTVTLQEFDLSIENAIKAQDFSTLDQLLDLSYQFIFVFMPFLYQDNKDHFNKAIPTTIFEWLVKLLTMVVSVDPLRDALPQQAMQADVVRTMEDMAMLFPESALFGQNDDRGEFSTPSAKHSIFTHSFRVMAQFTRDIDLHRQNYINYANENNKIVQKIEQINQCNPGQLINMKNHHLMRYNWATDRTECINSAISYLHDSLLQIAKAILVGTQDLGDGESAGYVSGAQHALFDCIHLVTSTETSVKLDDMKQCLDDMMELQL